MNSDMYIGVDIGTTVSKGVIIDSNGRLINNFQCLHHYDKSDKAEVWWAEFLEIVSNLLNANNIARENIKAITISAMVPNLVMLNAKGDIACETRLFTDRFAINEQNALDASDGTKWKNETLSKLIVLKDLINKNNVYSLLTTHCYIAFKLTGKLYCDLASAYEYGNVFDINSQRWNYERLSKIGIKEKILPEIISPIDTVGYISDWFAKKFHLSNNVKVIAGSHDSIATMIGAGLLYKNENLIYYGTFNSTAIMHYDIIDILCGETRDMPIEWTSSIPDSGPQFAQMCKIFANNGQYFDFDNLARSSLPGANGALFIQMPNLLQTSIASQSKGAFLNITSLVTHADLCRAIFESFGYGISAFWQVESFCPEKECFAAGGGARSDIRVQITSDILDIVQCKLENAENVVGTALIGIAAEDLELFYKLQLKRREQARQFLPKHDKIYDKQKEEYIKAIM